MNRRRSPCGCPKHDAGGRVGLVEEVVLVMGTVVMGWCRILDLTNP